MPSDGVVISIITTVGGLLTVYIASRLKNARPKKDRVDSVLEMYEGIIRNLKDENTRLREENDRQRNQEFNKRGKDKVT